MAKVLFCSVCVKDFVWFAGHEYKIVSEKDELEKVLEEFEPDYVFFLHWRWIVPETILSKFNCIGFHLGDLPKGRGGSPLQNLIVRGIKKTKLCAFKIVKELDAGPVFLREDFDISFGTCQEMLERINSRALIMAKTIIDKKIEPVPQVGLPSFFTRRVKEQSYLVPIHFEQVFDFIRMLDGFDYPKAYIDSSFFRLRFFEAKERGKDCVEARVIITKRDLNEL